MCSSNNSNDKLHLHYNNANFNSSWKVFSDEFYITLNNFTAVNDQLNNFVKTLNLSTGFFIHKKISLITLGIILN